MRAVAIEPNSEIAIVAEDAEPLWVSFASQPLVKFPTFTNSFAMLRAAAIDMIYGEKFYARLATASTLAAVMVDKELAFFFALIATAEISLLAVVSCPDVFVFGVSLILFSDFFGVGFLPLFVGFLVAFFACHPGLVVSSRVPRERFDGKALFAPITDSCSWLIACSIFGRSSVFLHRFSRFAFFNNQEMLSRL